jgi:chromosome segregation ATPase
MGWIWFKFKIDKFPNPQLLGEKEVGMNYLILLGIALCCGFLGYILHAICFSNSETVESLMKRNSALRGDLKEKGKALQNAREEIVRSEERIRLMEYQLQQRNKELDEIYRGALHRDEKIALLEKTVRELLVVPSKTDSSYNDSEPYTTQDTCESRERALRRQNLRSILNVLDSMDR